MKSKVFSLIFNIAETALIYFIGRLLSVPSNIIFMIMGVFFISRLLYGKPKHYNKWYRCCIWSCLVFTSLFTITSLELLPILILTTFTALISSGKADINDCYMWKRSGEASKYQDVIDYLKYHPLSDDIISFESKLRDTDNLSYLIYKYKFKDKKTFSQISELLDIETNRITDELDKLSFAFRMYCKF